MNEAGPGINYESIDGEPFTVGARTIRPQSHVLTVRWPNGGWVLNRPTSISVEEAGVAQQIPIPDPTRWGQWILIGAAILFVIIGIRAR